MMIVKIRVPSATGRSVADLIRDLGDISPTRIRLDPPPGVATINDLEEAKGCELVDGVLVEKAVGLLESFLSIHLATMLNQFVTAHDLGLVSGEDVGMRILTGIVRKPDVAFISWNRFPSGRLTKEPFPALAPDLAVEIISEGNTPKEMALKREEYFQAGVRLVWDINRFTRIVTAYTSPTQARELNDSEVLDGGDVLPGFSVAVRDIFSRIDRLA